MLSHQRRRRTPRDRGAVLVEAAIAFPVLMLIILGTVEAGFYFSSQSTTTTSSRDGARYATAFYAVKADKVAVGNEIKGEVEADLRALTGQGTPVQMWIYKATSSGDPAGGLSCTANCLRYTWNGATGEFDYQPGTSHVWSTVDACITAGSPALDEVGVMVEVSHQLLSGAFGSGQRTVRERSVLRLEPLPTNQCT